MHRSCPGAGQIDHKTSRKPIWHGTQGPLHCLRGPRTVHASLFIHAVATASRGELCATPTPLMAPASAVRFPTNRMTTTTVRWVQQMNACAIRSPIMAGTELTRQAECRMRCWPRAAQQHSPEIVPGAAAGACYTSRQHSQHCRDPHIHISNR